MRSESLAFLAGVAIVLSGAVAASGCVQKLAQSPVLSPPAIGSGALGAAATGRSAMPAKRPVGFIRVSVPWPHSSARRTQAIPGTTTAYQIKVSAPDLSPAIFLRLTANGSSSASAAMAVPAGTGRLLEVSGFNSIGRVVASGSVGGIVVNAGAHTPVTVPIAATVGALTGMATDSETGRPAEGVQVSAGPVSSFTDSTGLFTLEDVPLGNSTISYAGPGYATASLGSFTVQPGTMSVLPGQTMVPRRWTRQATGVTAQNLYSALALSDREVYAVGAQGTVLHTRDGGSVWLAEPMATATGSITADIYNLQGFATPAGTRLYAFTGAGIMTKLATDPVWAVLSSEMTGPGFTNQNRFSTGGSVIRSALSPTASPSGTIIPNSGSGWSYTSLLMDYYGNFLVFGPGSTQIVWFDNRDPDLSGMAICSSFGLYSDAESYHSLFGYNNYEFLVGATGSMVPRAVIRWSDDARFHGENPSDPDLGWRPKWWYSAPTNSYGGSLFRSIKPLVGIPTSGDGNYGPSWGFIAVGTNGEIAINYPNTGGFFKSWISDPGCATASLNDSSFVNSLAGWAVGDGGVVLKY